VFPYYTVTTLHFTQPNWLTAAESESESYATTDGQSASLSWYKAPIWVYDQIFIAVRNTEYVGQLRVCWYGALSLTRGRVCRLQLLLVLASAVILGSESLWDSRPYNCSSKLVPLIPSRNGQHRKHVPHCCISIIAVATCLRSRYSIKTVVCMFISRSLPSNVSTCHNITDNKC
jgi:hypothetical protein